MRDGETMVNVQVHPTLCLVLYRTIRYYTIACHTIMSFEKHQTQDTQWKRSPISIRNRVDCGRLETGEHHLLESVGQLLLQNNLWSVPVHTSRLVSPATASD